LRRNDVDVVQARVWHDLEHETMKKPTAKNLFERIDEGVREGVARALEEHRKAGNSVFIWRNGRIVKVAASRIKTGKANGKRHRDHGGAR